MQNNPYGHRSKLTATATATCPLLTGCGHVQAYISSLFITKTIETSHSDEEFLAGAGDAFQTGWFWAVCQQGRQRYRRVHRVQAGCYTPTLT